MALLITDSTPEWLFQREIVRLAEEKGWLIHYDIPAHRRGMLRTQSGGHNGFFDLVLAREGAVLFVELKSAKGKQSIAQKEWQLAANGVLWRPKDAEIIERTLK